MQETSTPVAGRGVSRGDGRAVLDGVDWKDRLPDVLARAADATTVDRWYVFENLRGTDGRLWMDLIGEWRAPGVRSLLDESSAHLHPYHPDFQAWIDVFAGGAEIVGPVDAMPEPARSALRAEGTAAVWLVPVIDGDGWWGFVGIDAVSPRGWTEADGDAIRALARQIGESSASPSTCAFGNNCWPRNALPGSSGLRCALE